MAKLSGEWKIETNGPIGGTSDFLFPHGATEVLARDGIESQFDSARDSELVIDRA